jgi:hypothetical protein
MCRPLSAYIALQQRRAFDADQRHQFCRYFAKPFDLGQRAQSISQA